MAIDSCGCMVRVVYSLMYYSTVGDVFEHVVGDAEDVQHVQ